MIKVSLFMGLLALFLLSTPAAFAGCYISEQSDYICDTLTPSTTTANTPHKKPAPRAPRSANPSLKMPKYDTTVIKGRKSTYRFVFDGAFCDGGDDSSRGGYIFENSPRSHKTLEFSSPTHKQMGRLSTTSMFNVSPVVTILDSSGNVVYSHTSTESAMVPIIFSDTGEMPEDVSKAVRLTYTVLKTNETYYFQGSVVTDTAPLSPDTFRMEFSSFPPPDKHISECVPSTKFSTP